MNQQQLSNTDRSNMMQNLGNRGDVIEENKEN
jgi:hypothetical protein